MLIPDPIKQAIVLKPISTIFLNSRQLGKVEIFWVDNFNKTFKTVC